jgi:hypothetical protein
MSRCSIGTRSKATCGVQPSKSSFSSGTTAASSKSPTIAISAGDCAVETLVEGAHLVQLRAVHLDQRFLDRRRVAPVALRIDVEVLRERVGASDSGSERLACRLVTVCDRQLVVLALRECRLLQHVRDEAQRRLQVRPRGLDRGARAGDAARHLEAVELVGELGSRVAGGAAREHAPGQRRVGLLAEEVLLVADVQR